jgi:hypothetical protein
MFYTLDRQPLGKFSKQLKKKVAVTEPCSGIAFDGVRGQLFPVIGMREKAVIRANFGGIGAEAFAWEDAESFILGKISFSELFTS